jgi:hypothetical protein
VEIVLTDVLHRIDSAYFQNADPPSIKWGRGLIKKRYRKLTLGTYDIRKNEIRIHPILKRTDIPQIVLDFVIYHEMLHAQDRLILAERYKKKLFHKRTSFKVHDTHFHKREKDFPYKAEASRIMHELTCGTFTAGNRQTLN